MGKGEREQGATKILRGFCHLPYLKIKLKGNEMRFILRENNAHYILRSKRGSSYEITASASVRSSSGTRKSPCFFSISVAKVFSIFCHFWANVSVCQPLWEKHVYLFSKHESYTPLSKHECVPLVNTCFVIVKLNLKRMIERWDADHCTNCWCNG